MPTPTLLIGPLTAAVDRPVPVARSIRVVSYNFLSGGSAARIGHWSRIVARFSPDIVLAQECRAPHDSPGERFRPQPTDTLLWAPAAARRWGSAVLLRGARATPLTIRRFEGWVVGAEVESAAWATSCPLRVFSIHCPAGERGYVRTLHEILDRIARLRGGADLVLGGDFNVVVGHRQPGERIAVTRGEREILERLAGEFDLISCWQAANPGRRLAQTLRWCADRSAPYHCDGIFVPSAWSEWLASCRVATGSRWTTLSDHNPVVALLTRSMEPRAAASSIRAVARSPLEFARVVRTPPRGKTGRPAKNWTGVAPTLDKRSLEASHLQVGQEDHPAVNPVNPESGESAGPRRRLDAIDAS